MKIVLLYSLLTLFFIHPGFCQDDCTVKASFTPDKDSVSSTPFGLQFSNTSTNATSVVWYVNGWWVSDQNILGFSFYQPGSYEIKLVAINGACTDTAVCYILQTGTQPPDRNNFKAYYGLPAIQDNATCLSAAKNGGYLLGGQSAYKKGQYSNFTGGLLINTAESGCINWTRLLEVGNGESKIIASAPLTDEGFAVAAHQNYDPFIMKLDKAGNLVWAKEYHFDDMPFIPRIITETENGGLLTSGTWTDMMVVMRMDGNGNVLWSKGFKKESDYPYTSFYSPISFLEKNNEVYLSGEAVAYRNVNTNVIFDVHGFLMKLNDITGATIWAREYFLNNSPLNTRDLHFYNNGLLMNSFANTGVAKSNNTFHFLDLDGNISGSVTLSTPFISSLTLQRGTFESSVIPLSNGDLYVQHSGVDYFTLQPGYTVWTNFIKLDPALNVRWSKVYGQLGSGGYIYTVEGQKSCIASLGGENGMTVPTYSSISTKMQFIKIDSSASPAIQTPQSSYCNFYDLPVTITPQLANAQIFSWTADSIMQASQTTFNAKLLTSYAQVRYTCPNEFIDSCSFIKINGPSTVCNLNDTLVYNVHRNKACFQPVQWQVPSQSTIISQSDTELKIKINAFGDYHVGALLPFSCTPVKDSIQLIAKPFEGLNLDLGRDTSLCPGNSIELNAGVGFLNYSWQDGSNGNSFMAYVPGMYWVQVTDSCHNILTDTIFISNAPAVPLSLGTDRVKCNNDTLHLNAPDDFLNYTWSPDYNINSVSLQQVIINPQSDTLYTIKAEKTPGCFGFDTIRITVNRSPQINLGVDTSFCSGQNITLNAGSNFVSYTWNTGESDSDILVSTTGKYFVKAVTDKGCASYDTLNVLNVYGLPDIRLNKDSTLCIGESRTLNAGNFKNYLWNDGSTGRTLIVNKTGLYAERVTDNNGCSNTDTIVIALMLPLPSGFLSASDSICQYGDLSLLPLKTFKSYFWSTNEMTKTVKVSVPGTYWLEVVDENNCMGKDTITVWSKECMIGFYAPSAFTPNSDGKNDLYKPLLFGNIKEFHFAIYNKWGELVFKSNTPGQTWDGKFNGKDLKTDVFVWICTYTLEGENAQTKKGTVTLIR